MRVLVACEYSGRVRDAFIRRGHQAVSVDLLPSDTRGPHYRGSIFGFLKEYPRWDLMIAHPPCTYLSAVGAGRWSEWAQNGQQEYAIDFFLSLMQANISRIALENPAGIMSKTWRKPDQYVMPWWFGDPWIKRTGLWLKNLPQLTPTDVVRPQGYWVDGGTFGRKGLSGSNEGAYNAHSRASRSHERSKTFKGLARAMAHQWG